jgi:hypothetical protein
VRKYDDTAQMHSWYNTLFYKYVRDEGLKKKDFTAAIQQAILQHEQIIPIKLINDYLKDSMKAKRN